MIRVGICDDKKLVCSNLEEIIIEVVKELSVEVECEIWYSGQKLKKYLEEGNRMEILFLDIELEECNGIDIGSFVRNELEDYGMSIVFFSYEKNYAMELFRIQPMDFLVKPITKNKVYDVMERFMKQNSEKKLFFEYNKGHKVYRLLYDEILYFQSMNRKIIIKTKKGEEEFYGKLQDIASGLNFSIFLQIHKSFIVNKNYIVEYGFEDIKLRSGEILPISKSYRNKVREELKEQLK